MDSWENREPVGYPEGEILRKWRESLGLTQQELGNRCPRTVGANRLHDMERKPHSLSVDSLLNVIHGLEIPGRDDAAKLARFFQGPERDAVADLLQQAEEDLLTAIRASQRARKKAE